jgi:hypothetical protein
MANEELDPGDYEQEDRALPSLLFKQNIIQTHEKMLYFRGRASLKWGGNDSTEFIIWLKECYGHMKHELERQISKHLNKTEAQKKEKKELENIKEEMDKWLVMGGVAGIHVSDNNRLKLYKMSDVVSKCIYDAGVTDLKVREGDPLKKYKKGFR